MHVRREYKAPVHTRDEIDAALVDADELVSAALFTAEERAALLPHVFNALIHSQVQFTVVQGEGILLGDAKA